jgi:hypothetical protein
MDVSELPDSQFEDKMFGNRHNSHDDFAMGTSGYLQFYEKIGGVAENDETEVELDAKCDPVVVQEIMDENLAFLKQQSIFDSAFFDFLESITDPDLTLQYFLNIFCHSHLDI